MAPWPAPDRRAGPRPSSSTPIAKRSSSAATSDKRRFRFIVTDYKASSDYKNLAESTRDQRGKWLDRIGEYFGDLSIAQFDRPEKIKPVIRRWRNQWADRPRIGDYAMQV